MSGYASPNTIQIGDISSFSIQLVQYTVRLPDSSATTLDDSNLVMRELSRELRLPINDFGYFRQYNRWHRITRRGWKTLELLADLYRTYMSGGDERCLIRGRTIIRELESKGAAACLNFVIRRTKLGSLRLLAIWIRGRIGGSLGIGGAECQG